MSRSARRVPGSTSIERFPWQRDAASKTAVARLPIRPLTDSSASSPPEPAGPHGRLTTVEREAFVQGYAAGEQAAEAAVAARTEALAGQMSRTVTELGTLRAEIMRSADQDLVRLALAMAERIVRYRLRVDQKLLLLMARAAVDRLGENVTATVSLNPADYEALPVVGHAAGTLEIVPDPRVARGGCLVRSAAGVIDAGVDAQVRELATILLGSDEHFDELASHAAPRA